MIFFTTEIEKKWISGQTWLGAHGGEVAVLLVGGQDQLSVAVTTHTSYCVHRVHLEKGRCVNL